ncbi:hypothetical protein [Leucothrix mucor]|uniref:hypothetical protein n=1 Tax=Leucothrix mucor TaxID=45248 RepID=UPI0003FB1682|nr:hypothetical protein [Leucothrix mucor]
MQTQNHYIQLETPTGPMQAQVFRPQQEGAFPAIIFIPKFFKSPPPLHEALTYWRD